MRCSLAFTLLFTFVGSWACTQTAGQDCPAGAEGCPCTSGGECDDALSCLSEVCVDAGGSTGDADDGASSATGQNTSASTTASTSATTASTTMTTSAEDSADDAVSVGDDGTSSGEHTTDPSTTSSSDGAGTSSDSSAGGEVVFDGAFLHNVDAASECDKWNDFRADLVGRTFTRISMSGSEDPAGRSCEGPAADSICQAIFSGAPSSIACDGEVWSIEDDCYGGLELDVAGILCDCGINYTVRPCSFTNFWGGLNTNSCDTPSQSIQVVCEYE